MKPDKAERIRTLFDLTEEDFSGKSTEFLMEVTCQRYFAQYRHTIDHGDVAEALTKTARTGQGGRTT